MRLLAEIYILLTCKKYNNGNSHLTLSWTKSFWKTAWSSKITKIKSDFKPVTTIFDCSSPLYWQAQNKNQQICPLLLIHFCIRKMAGVDKEEIDLLIWSCSWQNTAYAKISISWMKATQGKHCQKKKEKVIFLTSVIQLPFAYVGGRLSAGINCSKCINKAMLIYSSWEFVLQHIHPCAMW